MTQSRDYKLGYGNGYATGLRRGQRELQAAVRKKMEAMALELAGLKYRLSVQPPPQVPEQRAVLQMVLPGRSETALLLWPRDCDADDLEMIRDHSHNVLNRWISARSQHTMELPLEAQGNQ